MANFWAWEVWSPGNSGFVHHRVGGGGDGDLLSLPLPALPPPPPPHHKSLAEPCLEQGDVEQRAREWDPESINPVPAWQSQREIFVPRRMPVKDFLPGHWSKLALSAPCVDQHHMTLLPSASLVSS